MVSPMFLVNTRAVTKDVNETPLALNAVNVQISAGLRIKLSVELLKRKSYESWNENATLLYGCNHIWLRVYGP